MDEDVRKRLEYEEQFFGMSSLFFSDCFKKLVKDELDLKITLLTKNIEKKLLHQASNTDQFEAALQKMKVDLRNEYFNALDKLFPEIQAKISTLVSVPSNVLLEEDLCAKPGINRNLREIQEEVKTLKNKFAALLYVRKKILEEIQQADSAILCAEVALKK